MLKQWANIEKASSHSGRTALLTHIIHTLNLPISVAQKIAGHINPSTTVIYTQPTEQEISDALKSRIKTIEEKIKYQQEYIDSKIKEIDTVKLKFESDLNTYRQATRG